MKFYSVFSSDFSTEATDGTIELVTCQLRDVGEEEGSDAEDVEIWSHGPIVYRPDDPSDDGECQALVMDEAGKKLILATRDTRIAALAGAFNAGDAAFCGAGPKCPRLLTKKSGAVTLYQTGDTVDSYCGIDDDGSIVMGNQWGALSIGPDGITLQWGSLGICLNATGVTITGPIINLQGGGIYLGVGASVPLAVAPLVPVTGGVGFGVTKPTLNIFI